jgi:glycosyl transferase, family 25
MIVIENIFIINLNRRSDLLENIKYVFDFINKNYNINIQRIEGIDTIENVKNNNLIFNNFITNETLSLSATGLRKNKFNVLGEIGCYLSHKKCWEKILSDKLNNTLILEDGIIFHKHNFNNNIDINTDFDIIFTNKEMTYTNNYLTGYGLQSYIVSNKGAKKLLSECYSLTLPIDLQIRQLCNEKKIIWYVYSYFSENNNNKTSSISNAKIYLNDTNLNDKQSMDPIIVRIIKNMILKNISIFDFI